MKRERKGHKEERKREEREREKERRKVLESENMTKK